MKKTDKISFINFDAVSSVRSCEYKIVSDRLMKGLLLLPRKLLIILYLDSGLKHQDKEVQLRKVEFQILTYL